MKKLLTTHDVARRLGISYGAALRLLQTGAIYAWRRNPQAEHSTWTTTDAHVDRYLERGPAVEQATAPVARISCPPEAAARW